jgi:hypothetical protein
VGTKNRERRKKKAKLRNKRRSNNEQNKKNSGMKDGFSVYQMPDPFEGMNKSQRLATMTEIVASSKEKHELAVKKLRQLLLKCNPMQVNASFVSHGLMTYAGSDGLVKLDSELSFYQWQAEFLQALSLMVDLDSVCLEPTDPKDIQEIFDCLTEIGEASKFTNFNVPDSHGDETETKIGEIQDLIRGNTKQVRNWGYHSQVKRLVREIYSNLDEQVFEIHGFTATDVIDVFEAMTTTLEKRNQSRFDNLREVSKIQDKAKIVDVFFNYLEKPEDEAEEFKS